MCRQVLGTSSTVPASPPTPWCRPPCAILWARYPFDLINAVEGRGQEAVKEHDEILHALTTGDASVAMLAMRKHIESGWTVLKSA